MVNFPASPDSFADPAGNVTQGATTPTHSGHHKNHNDAIEALEAKLGTGASTPTSSTVLRGTGTGTTAFGQIQTADLGALAVSQYATAACTASQTTTSTSLVGVTTTPTAPLSLTTTGGVCLILISASLSFNALGPAARFVVQVDGAQQGTDYWVVSPGVTFWSTVAAVVAVVPAAGARTFSVAWSVTGNTGTIYGGQITVLELKR